MLYLFLILYVFSNSLLIMGVDSVTVEALETLLALRIVVELDWFDSFICRGHIPLLELSFKVLMLFANIELYGYLESASLLLADVIPGLLMPTGSV